MATIKDLFYPPDCPSCGPLPERFVDLEQLNVFESLLAHFGPMIVPFIVGVVVGVIIMLYAADDHSTVRPSSGITDNPGDF